LNSIPAEIVKSGCQGDPNPPCQPLFFTSSLPVPGIKIEVDEEDFVESQKYQTCQTN
jgi:hypothetical protein